MTPPPICLKSSYCRSRQCPGNVETDRRMPFLCEKGCSDRVPPRCLSATRCAYEAWHTVVPLVEVGKPRLRAIHPPALGEADNRVRSLASWPVCWTSLLAPCMHRAGAITVSVFPGPFSCSVSLFHSLSLFPLSFPVSSFSSHLSLFIIPALSGSFLLPSSAFGPSSPVSSPPDTLPSLCSWQEVTLRRWPCLSAVKCSYRGLSLLFS